MLSTEEFWTQVAVYNEATWPITIAMIVAAVFLTFRVFWRPGARSDMWMKAFLGFAFAWNGIVFFLLYVKNPLSTLTGASLFIIISLLFVVGVPPRKWIQDYARSGLWYNTILGGN
jgi:hypothetical protein